MRIYVFAKCMDMHSAMALLGLVANAFFAYINAKACISFKNTCKSRLKKD